MAILPPEGVVQEGPGQRLGYFEEREIASPEER